jgi:hypothetical protein
MLPQIAQGEANKVWIIPSEFTQALGQLGAAIQPGGPGDSGGGAGQRTPPPTAP